MNHVVRHVISPSTLPSILWCIVLSCSLLPNRPVDSATLISLVQYLLFLFRWPNPWPEAFCRYVDRSSGLMSNLLTCFPPAQHDFFYFNCLILIEASCVTKNVDQIINTYQLVSSSKYEIQ